jgi:DNA-binding transcriptional MerR regulator
MKIGDLAKTAGVSTQTIRFYEREGLLPKAMRGANGYRCYEVGMVERMGFIRSCADAGFTLREIGRLLDSGVDACDEVAELLDTKIANLGGRIVEMRKLKRSLENLRLRCDKSGHECGAMREIFPGTPTSGSLNGLCSEN